MANKIAVKVSGSIVSSLFFEHVNSPGDQEGFLLGELITRITRTISDSHMSAEKEETSINIYTIVPCDEQSFSFYDSAGNLHEEKLNYYMKDRIKDVIGWYKFRRNTPLEISVREQAVHENLCKKFAPGYQHFFLFGIFTSCDTHDTSTYTFDHIILRATRLGYERSSLNIINLGTTSHAEYLLHPHDATNILAGNFSQTVNSVDVGEVASVTHVHDMHKQLRLKLESVKDELATSEDIVGSICLYVAELERKIRSLQAIKDAERKAKEDSKVCEPSVEPAEEEDEHLSVVVQDNPELRHSDFQKVEENISENFPTNSTGSSNAEGQNKAITCSNTEGADGMEKDIAT